LIFGYICMTLGTVFLAAVTRLMIRNYRQGWNYDPAKSRWAPWASKTTEAAKS
jgi:hypothetical protein